MSMNTYTGFVASPGWSLGTLPLQSEWCPEVAGKPAAAETASWTPQGCLGGRAHAGIALRRHRYNPGTHTQLLKPAYMIHFLPYLKWLWDELTVVGKTMGWPGLTSCPFSVCSLFFCCTASGYWSLSSRAFLSCPASSLVSSSLWGYTILKLKPTLPVFLRVTSPSPTWSKSWKKTEKRQHCSLLIFKLSLFTRLYSKWYLPNKVCKKLLQVILEIHAWWAAFTLPVCGLW